MALFNRSKRTRPIVVIVEIYAIIVSVYFSICIYLIVGELVVDIITVSATASQIDQTIPPAVPFPVYLLDTPFVKNVEAAEQSYKSGLVITIIRVDGLLNPPLDRKLKWRLYGQRL